MEEGERYKKVYFDHRFVYFPAYNGKLYHDFIKREIK